MKLRSPMYSSLPKIRKCVDSMGKVSIFRKQSHTGVEHDGWAQKDFEKKFDKGSLRGTWRSLLDHSNSDTSKVHSIDYGLLYFLKVSSYLTGILAQWKYFYLIMMKGKGNFMWLKITHRKLINEQKNDFLKCCQNWFISNYS